MTDIDISTQRAFTFTVYSNNVHQ